MATNPRSKNGALRRRHRQRFKAMAAPCGICGGKLGPIHYDEPSNPQHPLSFVIDEIRPVSLWRQYGYGSPEAAAQDWNNLQPAHYICNQMKGARPGGPVKTGAQPTKAGAQAARRRIALDGKW